MKNKKYVKEYCWAFKDDEFFNNGEKTIEDTLKEAFNTASESNFENDILVVRIGEKRYYNDNYHLDFDDVLEKMKDYAWDEAGEIAEGYLECSKEDLEWAQEKFLTLWKQFKKRTKNERAFYFAENIEEYKLDINGNIILENV